MTDKCKGRTYDRNIPWGDKRVPCRRNAGPSNIGNDGIAVLQSSDRTIVIVGTDKRMIREHMRALLVSRANVARQNMERWEAARDALDDAWIAGDKP